MTHDQLVQAFRDWLGVPPAAGRVLAALYLARPQVVSHEDIARLARQTTAGVRESLKALRRSMEPEAIICAWGTGYQLGPAGLVDCEAALGNHQARDDHMRRFELDPTAQALREWFAVKPVDALILSALYAAGGQVAASAEIRTVTGQSPKGLQTSVAALRDAMDEGSILNAYGSGYRLTPTGLADCEAAFADARQRRAA